MSTSTSKLLIGAAGIGLLYYYLNNRVTAWNIPNYSFQEVASLQEVSAKTTGGRVVLGHNVVSGNPVVTFDLSNVAFGRQVIPAPLGEFSSKARQSRNKGISAVLLNVTFIRTVGFGTEERKVTYALDVSQLLAEESKAIILWQTGKEDVPFEARPRIPEPLRPPPKQEADARPGIVFDPATTSTGARSAVM
ncbi:MAG: hypothetical protein AABX74_05840 [Nanoarchaeota archaeon]